MDEGKPPRTQPTGYVAGTRCRTNSTRGVDKASANDVALGANGLASRVMHAESGLLNTTDQLHPGLSGSGIRVSAARTLPSARNGRYLNVRRLFNLISEPIMAGT